MPLHPQARAMIDRTAALNLPPVSQMTPAQARASVRRRSAALPREDVASVRDHPCPCRAARSPSACSRRSGAAPKPALVYFHGGGWVTGDIETHEGICRTLANAAGCVVASVDYRCAPEFTFPTAAEDCYAATRWVAEHAGELGVDARRLAVCGDSAGGNLAAAVALMARDRGGPRSRSRCSSIRSPTATSTRPSYTENAEGYLLTSESMRFYWDQYVPDAADARCIRTSRRCGPPVSPGCRPRSSSPRSTIRCATKAKRTRSALAHAGVPVTHSRYPGMIHAFFRFTNVLDAARAAVAEVVAALQKAWGTRSMTYKCLLYEVKDGIATLTLNRPERLNALGDTLRDDLHDAVTRASEDPEVRVMIVTGAGQGLLLGRRREGDERAQGERQRPAAHGEGRAEARPHRAGAARFAEAGHRGRQRRGRRRRHEPRALLRHAPRLDRREVLAGVRASAVSIPTGAAPTSCRASSAPPRRAS